MNAGDVRIGIIGTGRWGLNHVTTAVGLLGADRVTVFDEHPAAAAKVSAIAPSVRCAASLAELIADPTINGIVVATPAESHFTIARQCLENGKHVLVEKPITLRSADARTLVAMAEQKKLVLMVGHVMLYHPAIVAMKSMIQAGKIGTLQYFYSNRLNLGAIRSEENILWSFAPHDISILQYLIEADPVNIASHGARFVQNGIEDTTITYLTYPGNIHAHIFVSWLHPFKEQRLVAIGDNGMIVFEDSSAKDKLKFYPKGFHRTHDGIEKFDGEFEPVPFSAQPPLTAEHQHFYECILSGRRPLTDGEHALRVLEILEQASQQLRS